jgi:hypothetical protein
LDREELGRFTFLSPGFSAKRPSILSLVGKMDDGLPPHEEPRYLQFVRSDEVNGVDGKPMLNRYSTHLTREHDFPGAQVCIPGAIYLELPFLVVCLVFCH